MSVCVMTVGNARFGRVPTDDGKGLAWLFIMISMVTKTAWLKTGGGITKENNITVGYCIRSIRP